MVRKTLEMGEEAFLQQCEGESVLEINFRGAEWL